MPQLPYSTNLDPSDIFLVPKLKKPMKGKRFTTIDQIKSESKNEPMAIPKRAKYFKDRKKRWHTLIISMCTTLKEI